MKCHKVMSFFRKYTFILFVGSMMAISSCSEKAEQVAATETSDQMEEAKILGRNAAKEIVNENWTDTMSLQKAVLHARSISSRYDVEKDRQAREAFDSAFYSTIRTVRPDLANQLQGQD